MPTLRKPLELVAGFQHYDWGDRQFIPNLFGFAATAEPFAEAWLGAHPRLPTQVKLGQQQLSLEQLLKEHSQELLGRAVYQRFGGLPYLLKVLAAERPLSIQVHPSREQARAGFEREQRDGVPLSASYRNYRDDNHKPELLVALTPFVALCGFRQHAAIRQSLARAPALERLLPELAAGGASLKQLIQSYFSLSDDVRSTALLSWLAALGSGQDQEEQQRAQWVQRAHQLSQRAGMPDRGLFFFLLLNLFCLSPGQGLFLSDGVPHAYLAGAGVEVMANSDNVLRCGLTTKHTDDREVLSILRYEDALGHVLEPAPGAQPNVLSYATNVSEFQLQRLELHAGESSQVWRARGPEVLLVTSPAAEVKVSCPTQPTAGLTLGGGGSCLVPDAVEVVVQANSASSLVRVVVPNV